MAPRPSCCLCRWRWILGSFRAALRRAAAGFSYVNAHTRKESYKQSDHDCVQLTLRGTSIPKPRAQATIRPGTLRHPAVRAAVDELLTAAGAPSDEPDTTDDLWEGILDACTRHQRASVKVPPD